MNCGINKRTIKFRIWDLIEKKMLFMTKYEDALCDMESYATQPFYVPSQKPSFVFYLPKIGFLNIDTALSNQERFIFMMYVGCNDIHGYEIYEFDSVKVYEKPLLEEGEELFHGCIATVVWHDETCSFKLKTESGQFVHFGSLKLEVIPKDYASIN